MTFGYQGESGFRFTIRSPISAKRAPRDPSTQKPGGVTRSHCWLTGKPDRTESEKVANPGGPDFPEPKPAMEIIWHRRRFRAAFLAERN